MTGSERKIVGAIDGLNPPYEISGWAKDLSEPLRPLCVTALLNSAPIASAYTLLQRPDVGGRHGFALLAPAIEVWSSLSKGHLEIVAESQKLGVWEGLSDRLQVNGEETLLRSKQGSGEYSDIRLPVGLRAAKGLVTIGRNGHLFLVDGTNDLLRRYREDGSLQIDQVANEWIGLVKERTAAALRRGATFLQMFIPEKSSALAHLFPEQISPPLMIYRKVVGGLESDKVFSLLDCYPFLRGQEGCFLKLDTHLSSRGCFRVFEETLRTLDLPRPESPNFGAKAYAGGDLGRHLAGQWLLEEVTDDPVIDHPRLRGDSVVLEQEVRVEGHVGAQAVWKNPDAPIRKKVVVFGNSFFEMGYGPTCLSWWFARWFSEFHFKWSPEVDHDYLDRVEPDIVVAQTIERFLYTPPKA